MHKDLIIAIKFKYFFVRKKLRKEVFNNFTVFYG